MRVETQSHFHPVLLASLATASASFAGCPQSYVILCAQSCGLSWHVVDLSGGSSWADQSARCASGTAGRCANRSPPFAEAALWAAGQVPEACVQS